MEALIYDNGIITEHELYPVCGKKLQDVSEKDYHGKKYFDEHIECLDMDEYEKKACRAGDRKETVDAVIGIKKHLGKNNFSDSYLMLLELRMGYENVKNLSGTKLTDKVSHTQEILGRDKPLYGTIYFVFENRVAQRALSMFHSIKRANRNLKNCEPMSTDDFNRYIKPRSSYPYEPENDVAEIRKQLDINSYPGDINKFLGIMRYWCDKALQYKREYNIDEYNIISPELKAIWHEFRSNKDIELTDDNKLDIEIMEEDYTELRD